MSTSTRDVDTVVLNCTHYAYYTYYMHIIISVWKDGYYGCKQYLSSWFTSRFGLFMIIFDGWGQWNLMYFN